MDVVDFIKRWYGSELIPLTAACPEKTGIETRTFEHAEEAAAWAIEKNKTWNCYFSANPVTRAVDKKATRTDIRCVWTLHIDVDPRAGEDLASEQVRIRDLLSNPPEGIPKPTVIIFSGGGLQALWRLKNPIEISGDAAKADAAALFNKGLEIAFGADSTHNIDRLLRLPGLVNHPSAKKRARGQGEALAKVVEFHNDRVYDLSVFTPAVDEKHVERKIIDLDTLKIPDEIKTLIVNGCDPDKPNRYPSRSEALFAACCGMFRAGLDAAAVYGVITDPRYRISDSVLERKDADRYARKQVTTAQDKTTDADLSEMNEKFCAVLCVGGKFRIAVETFDEITRGERTVLVQQSDFRARLANRRKDLGNKKQMPLADWWLTHPRRRDAETIAFMPGGGPDNVLNLWKGFSVESRRDDRLSAPFWAHVRDNLCAGDQPSFDYLMGWLARLFQYPDRVGEVAVVLKGAQGTGKSFFMNAIGSLVAHHAISIQSSRHLIGNFNAYLRQIVLVLSEEAFYAGDRKHVGALKALITDPMIRVEMKGLEPEDARNHLHIIMATNEDWAVPVEFDDRRFLVLNVGDRRRQDHQYFGVLADDLDHGGREAILWDLLNRDLSGFSVLKFPRTKGHREQADYTMPIEMRWWLDKLQEGRVLPQIANWCLPVPKYDLAYDFSARCERAGWKSTNVAVGIFIKKVAEFETLRLSGTRECTMQDGSRRHVERPMCYLFRPLEVCRERFEKIMGQKIEWEPPEEKGDDAPF
jgi:hypothetical protein